MKKYRKTEVWEFIYHSEEEKAKHKEQLEKRGFEDSGQIRINVNKTFSNPKYEWYGRYTRYNY
ncbi:hypothetical protein KQI61_15470 [Anaerocolumna aminovalerica]|uniref:hypothetical protein n=1 Tax=Anaerocolumna aminovalerica TaxID=1527 RepID=UPI001C0ED9C5|nr:hypothetical protein [Anaerocolumna aminovalerica]MBU5333598.1 hypothetical protein [Anaerocolumna aminovalerica]